jgi:hypothetical protein
MANGRMSLLNTLARFRAKPLQSKVALDAPKKSKRAGQGPAQTLRHSVGTMTLVDLMLCQK